MAVEAPDQYCRDIEAYLCRKNDGHLIRIVGPAFEQVLGWAARGVPLTIACAGIDRYFERYYAKGPRRRPVRVEFCEADVLDVFDEWRRAVGVPSPDTPPLAAGKQSLPAHLERVIARITTLRGGVDRSLDDVFDALVRELDGHRATAKGLRGEARQALIERLRAFDVDLVAKARQRCDPATLTRLDAEALTELAPFRDRMPGPAFEEARQAAVNRLIRERYRLPTIAFD